MAHERQSLVYFVCLNYRNLPEGLKREIRVLTRECGGDWHQAVFEAVTTDRRILDVAVEMASDFVTLTESGLLKMVKRFYGKFFELPYMQTLVKGTGEDGEVHRRR